MSQYSNESDSKLLEKFGYKQDLKRSMKRFSSFAISFSLISILTGISANFHYGYTQVQGFVIFSWLLVFCGQFLVALVMSDLAVRYPLSGYGYQWASRLVNSKLFDLKTFLRIQTMTFQRSSLSIVLNCTKQIQ